MKINCQKSAVEVNDMPETSEPPALDAEVMDADAILTALKQGARVRFPALSGPGGTKYEAVRQLLTIQGGWVHLRRLGQAQPLYRRRRKAGCLPDRRLALNRSEAAQSRFAPRHFNLDKTKRKR